MPEEEPLKGLATLELVLEAKFVVRVIELEEVEQFRASFHDGKGSGLIVVQEDRDTSWQN